MMLLANIVWFAVSSAVYHPPTIVGAGLTNLVANSLVAVQAGFLLLAASHVVVSGAVATNGNAWLLSLVFLLCAHLLALLDTYVHGLIGEPYAPGWYRENLLALGLIACAIVLCLLIAWRNKTLYGMFALPQWWIATMGIGAIAALVIMGVLVVHNIVKMFADSGKNILGPT